MQETSLQPQPPISESAVETPTQVDTNTDNTVENSVESQAPKFISIDNELSLPEKTFIFLFALRAEASQAGKKALEILNKVNPDHQVIACGIFLYNLKRIIMSRNPQTTEKVKEYPPYEDIFGEPGLDGLNSRESLYIFQDPAILEETKAKELWESSWKGSEESAKYFNPFDTINS
jgi:hypothetical protein